VALELTLATRMALKLTLATRMALKLTLATWMALELTLATWMTLELTLATPGTRVTPSAFLYMMRVCASISSFIHSLRVCVIFLVPTILGLGNFQNCKVTLFVTYEVQGPILEVFVS
jgi:hypothetical protein